MRDILPDIDRWREDDKSIALATIVQTSGSAPRRVGSKMAFTLDGKITGSVSGGCVEAAVFEAGVEVLKTNTPQLLHFGVADETAWDVGLACGGSIDIFVKPLDTDFFKAVRSELVEEHSAVIVTVLRGPDELLGRELLVREAGDVTGTISDDLDQSVLKLARETLVEGVSRRAMLNESVEVFLEVSLP